MEYRSLASWILRNPALLEKRCAELRLSGVNLTGYTSLAQLDSRQLLAEEKIDQINLLNAVCRPVQIIQCHHIFGIVVFNII